jgi:hypothetical protein
MIVLLTHITYTEMFRKVTNTAWTRVLLDKLTVTQVLKKFVAFYGTKM